MKKYFFTIILACFFSINAFGNVAEDLIKTHCDLKKESRDVCYRKIEVAQIKKHSNLIVRDGGKLSLKMDTKEKNKTYENIYFDKNPNKPTTPNTKLIKDQFGTIGYFFFEYFEGLYLIAKTGHESEIYHLINKKTGEIHNLIDSPFFSPNKKHFILSSMDLVANFSPNRVEIWEEKSGSWKMTFHEDMGDTCALDNPVWTDNNNIVLERYCTTVLLPERAGTAQLKKTKDKWNLLEIKK